MVVGLGPLLCVSLFLVAWTLAQSSVATLVPSEEGMRDSWIGQQQVGQPNMSPYPLKQLGLQHENPPPASEWHERKEKKEVGSPEVEPPYVGMSLEDQQQLMGLAVLAGLVKEAHKLSDMKNHRQNSSMRGEEIGDEDLELYTHKENALSPFLLVQTKTHRKKGSSVLFLEAQKNDLMKERDIRKRGIVEYLTPKQVTEFYNKAFLALPKETVDFSQDHQRGREVCKDLAVSLFEVDMAEFQLEPNWLRKKGVIGVCPSQFVLRELGNHVVPSRIVEHKCACPSERCSTRGDYRCTHVRQLIRTWVLHKGGTYIPSSEMANVGCVCAQRLSPEARHAYGLLTS